LLTNITTGRQYRVAKAIGHIEHYANIGDYVSQIGVLNSAQQKTRFLGRVFVSPESGHLLNQHYLHQMFPLNAKGECQDTNAFMEMEVDYVTSLDGLDDNGEDREGLRESMTGAGEEVAFMGDADSPISPLNLAGSQLMMTTIDGKTNGSANGSATGSQTRTQTTKVKNLSRLWLYRNGGYPYEDMVRRAATS
jgi:hypothetical protein